MSTVLNEGIRVKLLDQRLSILDLLGILVFNSRFQLRLEEVIEEDETFLRLWIRARYGHHHAPLPEKMTAWKFTQKDLGDESSTNRLLKDLGPIIHGTSYEAWQGILESGKILPEYQIPGRKKRASIHFLACGFAHENTRQKRESAFIKLNSEIYLELDLVRWLNQGHEAYLYENGVMAIYEPVTMEDLLIVVRGNYCHPSKGQVGQIRSTNLLVDNVVHPEQGLPTFHYRVVNRFTEWPLKRKTSEQQSAGGMPPPKAPSSAPAEADSATTRGRAEERTQTSPTDRSRSSRRIVSKTAEEASKSSASSSVPPGEPKAKGFIRQEDKPVKPPPPKKMSAKAPKPPPPPGPGFKPKGAEPPPAKLPKEKKPPPEAPTKGRPAQSAPAEEIPYDPRKRPRIGVCERGLKTCIIGEKGLGSLCSKLKGIWRIQKWLSSEESLEMRSVSSSSTG